MSSHLPSIAAILLVLCAQSPLNGAPTSPCPGLFSYMYDGQWFGVARIHPQIYNQFHTDRIRLNVSLVVSRHIPNIQNLRLLDLQKPMADTLQDIGARRPILYHISFPFQDVMPALLRMHVNGIPVCVNRNILYGVSKIELQHTFYLPTLHDEAADADYFDAGFHGDETEPEPDVQPAHGGITGIGGIPNGPSVILNRGDLHFLKPTAQQLHSLAADSAACGTYDEAFKYTHLMSGGEKIAPGTWPWLVAIFRKEPTASNLAFLCTGSLITNRIVITAAHCFQLNALQRIATGEVVLAFGRHDIRDWTDRNMRLSNVNAIHMHPDYTRQRRANTFDADVAVVIAGDFVDFTAMVRPICLWPAVGAEATAINLIGTNGTLVGWGQPFENLESNTPRRLQLPIVETRHCFPAERVRRNQRIFCAGSERQGRAPCNGDSGSGLAVWLNGSWYLRGIVSAALGDPILNKCDLNTFVIFTDLLFFRTWIESFIGA